MEKICGKKPVAVLELTKNKVTKGDYTDNVKEFADKIKYAKDNLTKAKYYKVAYLRKPFTRPLAKAGDAEREEVVGEVTLEDRTGGKAGFVGEYHF